LLGRGRLETDIGRNCGKERGKDAKDPDISWMTFSTRAIIGGYVQTFVHAWITSIVANLTTLILTVTPPRPNVAIRPQICCLLSCRLRRSGNGNAKTVHPG
jgi:hypothetical protein